MIGNIAGSPRTTLAGATGVLFSVVGSQLVPALALYFGAQPGIIWQLLGMALGAIPGAFMTDLAKKVAAAIDPPKVALLLLVGGSLLFAAPARAQEVQPGGVLPSAGVCNGKGTVCLQPAVTVVPILIDFKSGNVSRNIGFGFGYGVIFPRVFNSASFTPGVDFLGGVQTGGGWIAALMPRLGVLRIGPVVSHLPGVTYAGLGVGTGM